MKRRGLYLDSIPFVNMWPNTLLDQSRPQVRYFLHRTMIDSWTHFVLKYFFVQIEMLFPHNFLVFSSPQNPHIFIRV